MKALTTILIAIVLPIMAQAQAQIVPSVSLKTLDERTVMAPNVICADELTLVYFFNENSRDLTDNFEYLENLAQGYGNQGKIKVIAIYNASNGSYGQLKPFLNGNAIDLETYIDINGELQRAMGLSASSTLLLCGSDQEFSTRYAESPDYSRELLDQQVSQLVGDYNSQSEGDKGLIKIPGGN